MSTKDRKLDHINICLKEDIQSRVKNGFEDITFVHRALPEIDKDDIDTSTDFFGKEILAPIIIAGMTGGHSKAKEINKNLALAAQELNIPMGVGSQRAAIDDETLEDTFSIVRDVAPDAFIIGNLGAVQFAKGYGIREAKKAVEMINADAIAIHLNPLHEVMQPKGDVNFRNCLREIGKLKLKVPVIAKETGGGIAREEAKKLEDVGIKGIDVGGLGGTSFSAVESFRNKNNNIGRLFWDWGIPTAISTIECVEYTNLKIIATGGIRNGIEVAKALALNAAACGLALPLLGKATRSHKDVIKEISRVVEELRAAMFLVGAQNIRDLIKTDLIIKGNTEKWLKSRKIDCKKYANRRYK